MFLHRYKEIAYCPDCDRNVPVSWVATNTGAHVVMLLLTAFFWLPVFLFAAYQTTAKSCPRCGCKEVRL